MQDYITEAFHIAARDTSSDYAVKMMNNIRKITALGVCAIEQNGCTPR